MMKKKSGKKRKTCSHFKMLKIMISEKMREKLERFFIELITENIQLNCIVTKLRQSFLYTNY